MELAETGANAVVRGRDGDGGGAFFPVELAEDGGGLSLRCNDAY